MRLSEHIGLLPSQPAFDEKNQPTASMHPAPTPHMYDFGSEEDKAVEDVLSDEFTDLWIGTGRRNREAFEKVFKPVSVHKQYPWFGDWYNFQRCPVMVSGTGKTTRNTWNRMPVSRWAGLYAPAVVLLTMIIWPRNFFRLVMSLTKLLLFRKWKKSLARSRAIWLTCPSTSALWVTGYWSLIELILDLQDLKWMTEGDWLSVNPYTLALYV